MAFHLKLLAKFSLTENHLLNYSCYILQKGFEIVISYNHIIDFRQLIKIIRNYVSFDILIVRVLQLDISRIIIFIIYSHFKWTIFVSNNTNSDTDFSFSLSTLTHEDVPNRTDIEERVSLRYKSGIASPPLQLVRRKLPWTRETSDRPSSWGERGLSLVEGKRARARQERCRNDR